MVTKIKKRKKQPTRTTVSGGPQQHMHDAKGQETDQKKYMITKRCSVHGTNETDSCVSAQNWALEGQGSQYKVAMCMCSTWVHFAWTIVQLHRAKPHVGIYTWAVRCSCTGTIKRVESRNVLHSDCRCFNSVLLRCDFYFYFGHGSSNHTSEWALQWHQIWHTCFFRSSSINHQSAFQMVHIRSENL